MPTKTERLDALEADLRTLSEDIDAVGDRLTLRDNRHTERHDQAMEIVGTRIGELAARLDKIDQLLATPFWQANGDPLGNIRRDGTAPFPTGAAATVDDALAAVPATDDPPRRGDRVRLEGARTAYLLKAVPDGWYDVIGWSETVDNPSFQIAADSAGWVPFIRDNSPAVKEIRRKVAAPAPRSPIEPADGLDV